MSQNKDLKEQLTELQEAFIKQSHQNMELATELETYHHQRLQAARAEEQVDSTNENPQENLSTSQLQSTSMHDQEAEEQASRLEVS